MLQALEEIQRSQRWPGVKMDFRFHEMSVLLVLDSMMKMLTLTVDM